MPKIDLSDEQWSELVDVVSDAVAFASGKLARMPDDYGPDAVEMKHRESMLLEILEVLENA